MGRAFTSKMTNSKIQEVDKTNPEACEETRKTAKTFFDEALIHLDMVKNPRGYLFLYAK